MKRLSAQAQPNRKSHDISVPFLLQRLLVKQQLAPLRLVAHLGHYLEQQEAAAMQRLLLHPVPQVGVARGFSPKFVEKVSCL